MKSAQLMDVYPIAPFLARYPLPSSLVSLLLYPSHTSLPPYTMLSFQRPSVGTGYLAHPLLIWSLSLFLCLSLIIHSWSLHPTPSGVKTPYLSLPFSLPEAREPVTHQASQVWEPNRLADSKVEQFLVVARYVCLCFLKNCEGCY